MFGVGCRPAPAVPVAVATPAVAPTTAPAPSASSAPQSDATKIARPEFDGEKAFEQLKKQCDFGPRPLGTAAHEKLADYLKAQMKRYADEMHTQTFTYRGMPVTNVIGVFTPEGAKEPSKTPVLLLAHWDTRPVADSPLSSELRRGSFRFGPRGWNRTAPVVGANDGASGVAVLLELARLFKTQKPKVGVLLLFTDGEDYGDFAANNAHGEGVLLGARHFAENFRKTEAFGLPLYGILLDMVGAKNLTIFREAFSHQYAPGTNEKVFGYAQRLGYGNIFRFDQMHRVEDDHVPLNEAGIPTIDLIQPFGTTEAGSYAYWHTPQDTPDKCSPKSLKAVGETVAEVIYRETP